MQAMADQIHTKGIPQGGRGPVRPSMTSPWQENAHPRSRGGQFAEKGIRAPKTVRGVPVGRDSVSLTV